MTTADVGEKPTPYDPNFIKKSLRAFKDHDAFTKEQKAWRKAEQFSEIPLFIPPSQDALNTEEQLSAQAYMFWRILQIYSYRYMKWEMDIPMFSQAYNLDPTMSRLCDIWQADLEDWENKTCVITGVADDGYDDIKYVTAFDSAFQQNSYRHMVGAVNDHILEDFCYPLFIQSAYENGDGNHTLLVRFVNVMFRSPNDRTVFSLTEDKKAWYNTILGKEFDDVL